MQAAVKYDMPGLGKRCEQRVRLYKDLIIHKTFLYLQLTALISPSNVVRIADLASRVPPAKKGLRRERASYLSENLWSVIPKLGGSGWPGGAAEGNSGRGRKNEEGQEEGEGEQEEGILRVGIIIRSNSKT